jgi:universal stress protein A
MFKRILVPTDLTDRGVRALDLALRLAASRSSRVTLLHVIETVRGLDFEEMKSLYQRLEKKARGTMTAAIGRLPPTDAEVTAEIVYGDRAEEVVNFAAAHDVDLIVLASHKVDVAAKGRDWGTISYKIGILAPCPVLLVK